MISFTAVANGITFIRLASVPWVIWVLLEGYNETAFILFVVMAITDAIDGSIARMAKETNQIGAYMDPFADKVLLVSVYVFFASTDAVPLWLVLLVVFRDVLLMFSLALNHVLEQKKALLPPILSSKINTFSQFVLATVVMAQQAFFILPLPLYEQCILIGSVIVAVTTAFSGGFYMRLWWFKN